jgi:hypothetical protein
MSAKYKAPDFRRFDGKRWVLGGPNDRGTSKRGAMRDATTARMKGWMARVVKAGGKYWMYTRASGRRRK